MLAFTINRRPRPARTSSAEQRLDRRLDLPRPKVRKSFEFIFATTKEESTGIEVMHSRSDRARWLDRYGAWYSTSPGLRDWLTRWRAGGGSAVL